MTMFSLNNKGPEPAPAPKPAATPARIAPAAVPRASGTSSSPSVSVISKALKITGQLESTEDIHIEGEIEGDVRGVSVTVGQDARIHGTVYGEHVELAGTLNGKIEARDVALTATAHMSGDIVHADIRIELGAWFDGHCRPERARSNGKAHAVQKPAAAPGEARTGPGTAAPTGKISLA